MRRTLGYTFLAAGLAALVAAGVTGARRGPEIAAQRESIAARIEQRSLTRDRLAEKRQQGAALRASKETMPDSTWQKERANVFLLQQRNDREVRALVSQDHAHTRWIKLEEVKLARMKRALAVRLGVLGGGGLLASALGWVLARRRVGA